MVKLIVFDFDGTLFDTRADIADAVNHARRRFALPEHPAEAITAMVGYGVSELARRAFLSTGVDLERALEPIMEYYSAHPGDKAELYPNVVETLALIPTPKAIVSNKPEALIHEILRKHGLSEFFVSVAGGDTFSSRKPDPEAVFDLCQRYSIDPKEILVVGDHVPDIQMARKLGSPCVYCRYGFFGDDASGADFEIDDFSQVLGVIAQLNGR